MSKLAHEFKDGRHIFTKDLCSFSVAADELAELVTAAQAALAEQNSGVMGSCEICSGSGFEGARTMQDGSYEDVPCRRCWNQPQAQRREA